MRWDDFSYFNRCGRSVVPKGACPPGIGDIESALVLRSVSGAMDRSRNLGDRAGPVPWMRYQRVVASDNHMNTQTTVIAVYGEIPFNLES
ncbi:hypothetical protein GCM10020219_072800 [Nonomuraea dietziae]